MKRNLIITVLCLIALSVTHLSAQTCQTTNIAAGKTVKVSTLPTEASYVVDGNYTTQWQPTTDGNQWLYIDLGANYTLCQVSLLWTAYHDLDTFDVQFSADTTTWTTLYHNTGLPVAGPSGSIYQLHNISLSSSTMTGRYVRIYFYNMTAWDDQLEEVQVYNQIPVNLPVVSLTAPSDGANYLEGDSVIFQATASETSGTISKVEFYQGTTLIGSSTTSPYKYVWHSVAEGEYAITAKAIDANGNSTASSTINVYVDYPSPGWSLSGNNGTNGDSSFLGTTDSMKFVLRTKNLKRMTILPNGNVGIGVDSPTAQLHTIGSIRYSSYRNNASMDSVLVTDSIGRLKQKALSSFGSFGHWQTSGTTTYDSSDNIGIGVSNTQGYKLAVNGSGIFTKVVVKPQGSWPDYVFKKNYRLPSLDVLERYIRQHNHLPGIVSAVDVAKKDGVDLGQNQADMLKKIEELTLYIIQQNKQLRERNQQAEEQRQQLQSQHTQLKDMQQQIDQLKKLILSK